MTEKRNWVTPAEARAAATIVPEGTFVSELFILIRTVSLVMGIIVCKSRRGVRFKRNGSWPVQQQVGEETPAAQRCSDAETFVAGRKPDAIAGLAGADEG